MKLTYWVAECLDDSQAYNIRHKTKKGATILRDSLSGRFSPVFKVTVEYTDGFDLMDQCSNEGRSWWESYPEVA